jgi:hypothetical protein
LSQLQRLKIRLATYGTMLYTGVIIDGNENNLESVERGNTDKIKLSGSVKVATKWV